jgi:alpha-ketoglutarate-dependent taurine dioxygenase
MPAELEIRPLTPKLGAEITGLDIAQIDDSGFAALYQHCTRPEFSCRFEWTPGSRVMWDNRSTMHYAVNDYDGYRHCLYRTTVMGEAPLPA